MAEAECEGEQSFSACAGDCRCSYSKYNEKEPSPKTKGCPKIKRCRVNVFTRSKGCKCPFDPPKKPQETECPKFGQGCCILPNYYYGDKYCPHVLVGYWEDERLKFVNDKVTKKSIYKRDFIPHTITPRDLLLITKLRMKNQGAGCYLTNCEPAPSDCASQSTYQMSFNQYKCCGRISQRPLHDFARGLYCSPTSVRECLGLCKNEIPIKSVKCPIPPPGQGYDDVRKRHKIETKELLCQDYYFIPRARKEPPSCGLQYCPVVTSPLCRAAKLKTRTPFFDQKC